MAQMKNILDTEEIPLVDVTKSKKEIEQLIQAGVNNIYFFCFLTVWRNPHKLRDG